MFSIEHGIKPPVLAYHHVGTGPQMAITWVPKRTFAKQIRYLFEAGYRSLTLQDLVQEGCPAGEKAIAITFDDAYASIGESAYPVLSRYGFVATVFVIGAYMGRENRWDVRLPGMRARHLDAPSLQHLVSEGWEVGSHTLTHARLTALDPRRQWTELQASRLLLEDTLGTEVRSLAFPFSRYNEQTLRLARRAGYRIACTLDGKTSCRVDHGLAVVSRCGIYLFHGRRGFLRQLRSSDGTRWSRFQQRVIHGCSQGTWWVKSRMLQQKGLAILSFFS